LIEEARQTTNIDQRTSFYKQAQVIFEQEAPWKPLAHQIVVVPMLKKVHGFKLDSFGKREFRNVWIEK
ncbi:MAG: ABC transporter substrate-binding protein, partial [Campylobacteraceae bacterium]|nr:ABC transporter substrate-binding protein [Campylobacteraceae bacterium]